MRPLYALFQATRPHGARHRRALRGHIALCVSSHAPARGATTMILPSLPLQLAFQATRPHGARRKAYRENSPYPLFQATRPHGARRYTLLVEDDLMGFKPRARTGRDRE